MNEMNGIGTYQIGEIVYQGYSAGTSSATGKVVFWNDNNLHLTNINGNFISNLPVIGLASNANYTFYNYNIVPQKLVQIDIIPNPSDANGAEPWTANTTIQEFPQVFTPVVPTQPVPEIIDLNDSFGFHDLENDLGLYD
jgi:hypothetical protein